MSAKHQHIPFDGKTTDSIPENKITMKWRTSFASKMSVPLAQNAFMSLPSQSNELHKSKSSQIVKFRQHFFANYCRGQIHWCNGGWTGTDLPRAARTFKFLIWIWGAFWRTKKMSEIHRMWEKISTEQFDAFVRYMTGSIKSYPASARTWSCCTCGASFVAISESSPIHFGRHYMRDGRNKYVYINIFVRCLNSRFFMKRVCQPAQLTLHRSFCTYTHHRAVIFVFVSAEFYFWLWWKWKILAPSEVTHAHTGPTPLTHRVEFTLKRVSCLPIGETKTKVKRISIFHTCLAVLLFTYVYLSPQISRYLSPSHPKNQWICSFWHVYTNAFHLWANTF